MVRPGLRYIAAAHNNMKTAIYPGTFDPVTLGHLNIIERAATIFDHLIVCAMVNSKKHPLFSSDERVDLIRRSTQHLPNVTVEASGMLLADFARSRGSCVIVKGLRAMSDFEKEFQMAQINSKLYPDLDTMFLTAANRYMYLSSSAVKELGSYNADLSDFIPAEILQDVVDRIHNRRD